MWKTSSARSPSTTTSGSSSRVSTCTGMSLGVSTSAPCRRAPLTSDRIHLTEVAMPELMIDVITSLEGYGAAEGWPGFWGLEGPEYLAWLEEDSEGDYTVLMGANTYRLMSSLV